MKVSVVIPAHNEQNYLGRCLTSLQNQQEAADEIIVIDNNSSDNTCFIARSFNVKLGEEKLPGIIATVRRGFNMAKGEIIVRCDADTLVPFDWIKKIKKNFRETKIDALGGTAIFYDFVLKTTFFTNLYLDLMKIMQKGDETLIGFNLALTKKMWLRVRDQLCCDDTQVHEDVDLAIHIAKMGGVIKIDKSLVVEVSARRILKHPVSFFGEYPIRLIKTFKAHQQT